MSKINKRLVKLWKDYLKLSIKANKAKARAEIAWNIFLEAQEESE